MGIPTVVQQLQTQLVSMRIRVQSLASFSGLRIQRCHELWVSLGCGSNPELLWLWCRPAATAPLRGPLAWEPPYALRAALKKTEKKMCNTRQRAVLLQLQ